MCVEFYFIFYVVVMGVGIGGILVIIGCYICYKGLFIMLIVVDFEYFVFF